MLAPPSTSQRRAVDPDDLGLSARVELVAQVTHQRRQEVLHREHARHPAVLVHDDGERPPVAAHVGEHVEHEAALGDG